MTRGVDNFTIPCEIWCLLMECQVWTMRVNWELTSTVGPVSSSSESSSPLESVVLQSPREKERLCKNYKMENFSPREIQYSKYFYIQEKNENKAPRYLLLCWKRGLWWWQYPSHQYSAEAIKLCKAHWSDQAHLYWCCWPLRTALLAHQNRWDKPWKYLKVNTLSDTQPHLTHRRGLLDCSGRRNLLLVQSLQATIPHFRQWWRLHRESVSKYLERDWAGQTHLLTKENWTFLQCMQVLASLSGTHTAAWLSAGFFPDFRMSSSIHCEDLKMKTKLFTGQKWW